MTTDKTPPDDGPPDEDDTDMPDDEMGPGEHHSIEDEIEEILREKGEAPGQAYRPPPPRFPNLPQFGPVATDVAQGFLILALGAVLLFVAFKAMGPNGFKFGAMALLIFLGFYALRPIIREYLRRRSR
jgi:hypothetical protein